MQIKSDIKPFDKCPAMDGYHCQTNSLAKIYHYYGHPLTEEMLLGLGSGMGFIYWKMKMGNGMYVFIGGRGNNKEFFHDIGKRTGVGIKEISSSSAQKSEVSLLNKLKEKEPVMLFGDMGFLPWFSFPQEYHFGGHTFVICGYDGRSTLLVSDMDPSATGLKKGFFSPITLEQLKKARNSPYKPFPPKNTYFEFDFRNYTGPNKETIYSAIKQTSESQLNPPIKNIGIKGIRHTSKEILKWPDYFNEQDLRMNLFSLFIFIEIGGTGGGCFRYMYSKFIKESIKITKNRRLLQAAERFQESGELFTEIGQLFKDSETFKDINQRIKKSSELFSKIADIEESSYSYLSDIVKQ